MSLRIEIKIHCDLLKRSIRLTYFFSDQLRLLFLHPLIRTFFKTILELTIKRALRSTIQTGKFLYTLYFPIIIHYKIFKMPCIPQYRRKKSKLFFLRIISSQNQQNLLLFDKMHMFTLHLSI